MIEVLRKTEPYKQTVTMNPAADYEHILIQFNDHETGEQVRISFTPEQAEDLIEDIAHFNTIRAETNKQKQQLQLIH